MKEKIKVYYNENYHFHIEYSFIEEKDSYGFIEVDYETYMKLHSRPANSNWVYKNNKIELEFFEISRTIEENNQDRMDFILNWFIENDWKINKVFLGEWNKEDLRFKEYLETRKKLREELDHIEKELNI